MENNESVWDRLHDNDEPDATEYNDKKYMDAAKDAFLKESEADEDDNADKAAIRRILSGKYDNVPEGLMPKGDDEEDSKWDKFKV